MKSGLLDPAELMWRAAHTWQCHANTCKRLHGAKDNGQVFDGPTSIVGPSKMGGRTRRSERRKSLRSSPPLYPSFSILFPRVGLITPSEFTGNVAAPGTSDQRAAIDTRRSCGLRST